MRESLSLCLLCTTVKVVGREAPKLAPQAKIRFRCWHHLNATSESWPFDPTQTSLGQVASLALGDLYSNLDMTLT